MRSLFPPASDRNEAYVWTGGGVHPRRPQLFVLLGAVRGLSATESATHAGVTRRDHDDAESLATHQGALSGGVRSERGQA